MPYDNPLDAVEANLMLLKWMIGFNLALTIAIAAKLFLGH